MATDITLLTSSALPRANAEAMPARVEAHVLSRALGTATECQLAAVVGHTPGTIEPDRHIIDEAVAEWRRHIHSLRTSVQFSIDGNSGKLVIRAIDADDKELIRQILPEQALALARIFKELDAGETQALTLGMRGFSVGTGSLERMLLRTKAQLIGS